MMRKIFLALLCLLVPFWLAAAPATQHKKHVPQHGVHHHSRHSRHGHTRAHVHYESHPLAVVEAMQTSQASVCSTAESQVGIAYQWGGTTPENGFDCSGFSRYVFQKQGITIPRTAAEQFHALTPVHQLQRGDLVFFRTHGRHVSHVGIYLGNGRFIHSPRTGEDIREDSLSNPYWRHHYVGARRAISWNYVASRFNSSDRFLQQLQAGS